MMKHNSIPRCAAYETDQTIVDREGIRLGIIRAYADGYGPFNVWRSDGKYLGEHKDYMMALCAVTERRTAKKRPAYKVAAARQPSQTIKSMPRTITTAGMF